MTDHSDPQRRRFLGGVATAIALGATTSLAGCLDSSGSGDGSGLDFEDDDSEGDADDDRGATDESDGAESEDDSTEEAEPDRLPAGLTADGIEIDALRETVADVIADESYDILVVRNVHTDGGDRFENAQALNGRVDADRERALEVEASDSETEIDEELDGAETVSYRYFDGDESYRNRESTDPQPIDGGFDSFTREVRDRWHAEIFDIVEQIEWGSPEWELQTDAYVVPVVGVVDDDESVELQGEMHVNADGVPVSLEGQIRDGDWVTSDRVHFEFGAITVDEPTWVDRAR